jgi:hypothetical protein
MFGVKQRRTKQAVRARKTFVLLTVVTIAFVLLPSSSKADACRTPVGQRIQLAALSSDPDVFVWDSRSRLIDYAAGHFDNTNQVLAHTVLAKPGTHAIVAMCADGVVKPNYSDGRFDAVGIKITSGPLRNRWGWVSSEDVR